ncbi:hypothetical protein QC762_109587 [Podospora pseudocomata]|uniref:Uncharacterized protein n=1 Tax=Podospora pseudocomata TaxID=2093779 RepID=A0ABR0GUD3_9PEZI|nr:hypothetical protein QC762_109587 [Podospora pseudocomata]
MLKTLFRKHSTSITACEAGPEVGVLARPTKDWLQMWDVRTPETTTDSEHRLRRPSTPRRSASVVSRDFG